MFGFQACRRGIGINDVARDPAIKERFALAARHVAANLVAHHGFQVVSETGNGQDVAEIGREPGVGIGGIGIVLFGFLTTLHTEEGRIIGVLAVHERNETEIGQILFAAISNGYFGGSFHGDIAFVGGEIVHRQSLNLAAAFHAANGGAPVVLRE